MQGIVCTRCRIYFAEWHIDYRTKLGLYADSPQRGPVAISALTDFNLKGLRMM